MRFKYAYLLSAIAISLLSTTSVKAMQLNASASISLPQGNLDSYMNGGMIVGGHLRVIGSSGAKNIFFQPKFFGEFSIIDYRDENHFNPEGRYVGSDTYGLEFGPGVIFEKSQSNFRPALGLYGGVAYYSVMGYLQGRESPYLIPVKTIKTTTWYAGVEAGVSLMFWERKPASKLPLLDEFLVFFRLGYTTTGKVSSVDLKSFSADGEITSEDQLELAMTRISLRYGFTMTF